MKSLLLCIVVFVCLITGCASTASANDYGIALAPGEVLVAVNGVRVSQPAMVTRSVPTPVRSTVRAFVGACANGVCNLRQQAPVRNVFIRW